MKWVYTVVEHVVYRHLEGDAPELFGMFRSFQHACLAARALNGHKPNLTAPSPAVGAALITYTEMLWCYRTRQIQNLPLDPKLANPMAVSSSLSEQDQEVFKHCIQELTFWYHCDKESWAEGVELNTFLDRLNQSARFIVNSMESNGTNGAS